VGIKQTCSWMPFLSAAVAGLAVHVAVQVAAARRMQDAGKIPVCSASWEAVFFCVLQGLEGLSSSCAPCCHHPTLLVNPNVARAVLFFWFKPQCCLVGASSFTMCALPLLAGRWMWLLTDAGHPLVALPMGCRLFVVMCILLGLMADNLAVCHSTLAWVGCRTPTHAASQLPLRFSGVLFGLPLPAAPAMHDGGQHRLMDLGLGSGCCLLHRYCCIFEDCVVGCLAALSAMALPSFWCCCMCHQSNGDWLEVSHQLPGDVQGIIRY
jgi:hypothetical protein